MAVNADGTCQLPSTVVLCSAGPFDHDNNAASPPVQRYQITFLGVFSKIPIPVVMSAGPPPPPLPPGAPCCNGEVASIQPFPVAGGFRIDYWFLDGLHRVNHIVATDGY